MGPRLFLAFGLPSTSKVIGTSGGSSVRRGEYILLPSPTNSRLASASRKHSRVSRNGRSFCSVNFESQESTADLKQQLLLYTHTGVRNDAEFFKAGHRLGEEMSSNLPGIVTMFRAEHPNTLKIMSNLAALLHGQGKYEAAETRIREVMGIQQTVLGAEDEATLTSMNNLAIVLSDQQQYVAAEPLQEACCTSSLPVLGIQHPRTEKRMRSFANLAQTGPFGTYYIIHLPPGLD
ncbi:uncharacterized protein Z519_08713 [Cladophialophora bantiana CBS 173.52]|uniref:MalT-like TPR region domain-containing protein n=1 Tax=Cladophialophora bantiana (strain ATCC 10958 / CBS 173.52 / CDC B-1940 / NIH 8579) TaxID=1442370 RepID=A0A0D2HJK2_CLAB1|nr:uncharacterized protein Z519_08713 [Cladophialophora bantiana CBS 173.52]KIW90930.1 hypothetical protein Z519_08713 [Cladophialophora bantiana CBS 173.52]